MKNLFLLLSMIAFGFFACTESPKPNETATSTHEPTGNGGSQDDPDLVAIDEAIHGFYKWYEANMNTLANINYVKGGKSSTLDNAQLEAYYALLLKSGFISQAYVDADRAYLKNLEATAWKSENVEEEPITGLDYDRLFCAQDFDINFWVSAPVAAEGLGTDQALATMTGDEGGSERSQKFELKKENGKWLIAKILCE
jgi:hypothetical protein